MTAEAKKALDAFQWCAYKDVRIAEEAQAALDSYNEEYKMEVWLPPPKGQEWDAFVARNAALSHLESDFNCMSDFLETVKARINKDFATWLAKIMTGFLRHKVINFSRVMTVEIKEPMYQFFVPWAPSRKLCAR